ncbi:MAG: hypothetical protein KJZ92_16625, partial [Rhodocyclaceae bacterium]|nr:hypothetical protein [Rhodocyclaceae bacterium]
GGGGADSVSVSSTQSIDPYSAIVKTIGAMLSEGNASTASAAAPATGAARGGAGAPAAGGGASVSGVVANPELGIITVTAPPPTLDRVAEYIDSINRRFAQNVMIDVKIYSVNASKEMGGGFSLTALLGILGKYGLAVAGAPILATTAAQSTMTVESRGANHQTSLMISALQQFGDVSLVRSGQVIAVNGQPAPMQLAEEITYLASTSTTQAANVGTTTTLTPGKQTVGFTANFLPMILGDNRILLQYQINLSSLLALTQVSSGSASIQTPSVSTQTLQQQAFVRDGESIVLFGFDSDRNATQEAAGIGNLSKTAHTQRNLLVIVMQVFGGQKDAALNPAQRPAQHDSRKAA